MSISYNFLQRTAIGVTTGLFALTTFVVYTRLYIRCILIKAGSAGYDDLTVFIAWVSCATCHPLHKNTFIFRLQKMRIPFLHSLT